MNGNESRYCQRIFDMSITYNNNMNKLKHNIIIGIIFVLITGTISHFVYDWSGKNPILGLIFPINESVWEHMKLCFFPMLFYSYYMNQKVKDDYPCVTSSLLFGILMSTFLIPVHFYSYSGTLGYNSTFLDISTFILSVLLSFTVIYKFTLSCKLPRYMPLLKFAVIITAVCFIIFTYFPPNLGIFKDPTR